VHLGVAWVLTAGETPTLADIHAVQNWGSSIGPKVPSTYTYSANRGDSWGYGIGDNAYVIRWTKLELEPPSLLNALKTLRRTLLEAEQLGFTDENVLQNQIPRHLIRTPPDVMTDYLTEVAACVRRDIESKRDRDTVGKFPMDFVITHPAKWDDRAKNLTFRAVNTAFEHVFPELETKLGNIYLATEPEACAHYTMRSGQDEGIRSLRRGDCFMVVDAGGGTVDLVSYRVDEVAPHFRVTKVTEVSGGQCGATCVDNDFLYNFLPRKLNQHEYNFIAGSGPWEEHGEGAHTVLKRHEQFMLKNFMPIKHKFAGRYNSDEEPLVDVITLPEGIGRIDNLASNIQDGQLIITW
jgi:hypothetical protein